CYVDEFSSIHNFTTFLKGITNNAKVYSKKILPLSILVIQSIQDFTENYVLIDFDEFKNKINGIANKANKSYEETRCIEKLYNAILESFKTKQDNKDANRAIKKDKESKLAAAAACLIRDVLKTSIENFVTALTKIESFFAILKCELSYLAHNPDESEIKKHYDKCNKGIKTIIGECKYFIGMILDCQANLEVIPDKVNENYVEQWVLKKTSQDRQTISLLES
ncbi:18448_t:CDS:2, partial [Dentiscutata erythropus]